MSLRSFLSFFTCRSRRSFAPPPTGPRRSCARWVAGVAGVLCCLGSAQAALIYSGLQNIPIATTFAGVYVDVENTNNATNHGSTTITGWDVNLFFGGVGEFNEPNFQPVRASSGDSFSAIQNLAVGTLIGAGSTFASGTGGSGDIGSEHVGFGANQFQPGVEGIIGFKLITMSGPFYGWMRVALTFNDPGAEIIDWAYDDTGATILAGVIPEPSRVMLLMMGLTTVMLRRRREGLPHKVTAPART